MPVVEPADHPPPVPEILAAELALVARGGARSSQKLVDNVPTLTGLQIVRSRATSEASQEQVLRMVEVLDEAVDRIEDRRSQEAARILLGLDPEASGNLTARRNRAAEGLYGPYGRNERTFRGTDEPELLRRVADKLYLMEGEHQRAGHIAFVPAVPAPAAEPDAAGVSAPTESPGRPASRHRNRRALWIATAAVLSVALILIVATRLTTHPEKAPTAPRTVLFETFSARNRGWSDDAVFRYDEATYVGALARGRADGRASRAPVGPDDLPADLRISVEGTKTSEGAGGSFGVFCRDTDGLRYGARIDPESQSYTLYKVETKGEPGKRVVPIGVSTSIRRAGSNTISLECTGDAAGQQPVVLTLFVNSERVSGWVDPIGYPSGWVGVEIASGTGGVEVRLDNLEVSRA